MPGREARVPNKALKLTRLSGCLLQLRRPRVLYRNHITIVRPIIDNISIC